MEPFTIKVYVAGPYTKPDPCINTKEACEVANKLCDLGFIPFVPHLSHLWHLITPKPYEWWLKYDLEWLKSCDALLRFPGESSGADKEVEFAKELGIPVFHSLDTIQAYFPGA
jgi:hypothetical protein